MLIPVTEKKKKLLISITMLIPVIEKKKKQFQHQDLQLRNQRQKLRRDIVGNDAIHCDVFRVNCEVSAILSNTNSKKR